jgi:uncharacterized protein (DUF983 family)
LKREPTKRCPRCCETKLLDDFLLLKSGQCDTWCRPCRREYHLIDYADRKRGYSLDKAFEPDLESS